MIRQIWQALGRLLRALDGCANPKYKPTEITEDPDALGYAGAAPDFAAREAGRSEAEQIALENAWDDDAFEHWRASL